MLLTILSDQSPFFDDAFLDQDGSPANYLQPARTTTEFSLEKLSDGMQLRFFGEFVYSDRGALLGGDITRIEWGSGNATSSVVTDIQWDILKTIFAIDAYQRGNTASFARLLNASDAITVDASAIGATQLPLFPGAESLITVPILLDATGVYGTFVGGLGDDVFQIGYINRSYPARQITVEATPGADTYDFEHANHGGSYRLTFDTLGAPIDVTIDGVTGDGSVTAPGAAHRLVSVSDALENSPLLTLHGTEGEDRFDVVLAHGQSMTLRPDLGNDTVTYAAGGELTIEFGRGQDGLAARFGVIANLETGEVANDSWGYTDQLILTGADAGPAPNSDRGVPDAAASSGLRLRTTEHADHIIGSGLDETFVLFGGADTIEGGAGVDTIDLVDMDARDIVADLEAGYVLGSYQGQEFRAELSGIESIIFQQSGARLYGSASDDVFVQQFHRSFGSVFVGREGGDVLEQAGVAIGEHYGLFHLEQSAQVFRLYQSVLGRTPDLEGHQRWTTELTVGALTLDDAAAAFVRSAEFQKTFGNTSDPDFVTLLYENVFDRTPVDTERDAWAANLADGMARSEVVRRFSESAEHRILTDPDLADFETTHDATNWGDDIFRLFRAIFDRDPDKSGYLEWIAHLAEGRFDFATVVSRFMQSPEFQTTYGPATDAEFISLLYANVLKRTADAAGQQGWEGNLAGGMTREEVVIRFMQSPEFVTATEAAMKGFVRDLGGGDVITFRSNTTASGGALADTFVFTGFGAAQQTVTDLEPWDFLDFAVFEKDPAQVLDAMQQDGDAVVFTNGTGVIRFLDTQLGDIHADMILV